MQFSKQDEAFMRDALRQAKKALYCGEVPVGCIIARDGHIISRGHNLTNLTKNGTRHAEMIAIDSILSSNKDGDKADFASCTLYVTCEPCIMCAGALSLLNFQNVIYGCPNDKFGGNGSILSIHETSCGSCATETHGGTYTSVGGLLREEAIKLLQDFYISGNPNAPKPHRPMRNK